MYDWNRMIMKYANIFNIYMKHITSIIVIIIYKKIIIMIYIVNLIPFLHSFWEPIFLKLGCVIIMPFFRWGFLSGSIQSSNLKQNQTANILWRNGEPGGILDPIMLITGIQSVFEPRGELVAANCEILTESRRIWEFFTGFPNARHQTMFRWWCEKSDYTT